mgnify:CR=1 FL=1
MQALHVVSPSDSLTTVEMVGLLRITQQQLGGKQHILVIGDDAAVVRMTQSGMSILGSLDGSVDSSRTLISRFERLLTTAYSNGLTHIVGWGSQASSVVSRLESGLQKVAYIDGIDPKSSLQSNNTLFIPTSWHGATCLLDMGIEEDWVSEPLVGVEPTTIIASPSFVRETLQLQGSPKVIAIVGDASSSSEIIQMVYRMKTTGQNVAFVLPYDCNGRGELMQHAKQRDVANLLYSPPPSLRAIDVVAFADGVWVPNIAGALSRGCVLELLKVAWEGVPLAVPYSHPVRSVPMIGSTIAWAKTQLDISTWMLDCICAEANGESHNELAANVRSIAAPTRFVEGLQQRSSVASTLRSCV